MRLRCRLFGCDYDRLTALCSRCGEFLYDPDWIDTGLLTPTITRLHDAGWWIRRLILGTRCDVCKKRFRHGVSPRVCSKECLENWVPF